MFLEKNESIACSNETNPGNELFGYSQLVFPAPTYRELTEFHLKRVELDNAGNKRSKQALDNERSTLNNWVAKLGLDPFGAVGEELGIRFNESLAEYVTALEDGDLARQTISGRKSIVRKFRESFLEFKRTSGLPQDFSGALRSLAELAGISIRKLSKKTGISRSTVYHWVGGNYFPSRSSLEKIRKLEKFFDIAEGTLSSRLPDVIWVKEPPRSCSTPWRKNQRDLLKLKYLLKCFPDRLCVEWDELFLFYTDEQWVRSQGLKRKGEWRIRWNNGKCPTADFHLSQLHSFFGYLCLPTTNNDKRITGLGFKPEDLTLALLTDADLVIKYLYFMKGRSVLKSFNRTTLSFLHFCLMLLRDKTGYLRQLPRFGALLAMPVVGADWSSWCKKNRKKIRKFLRTITESKKDGVRMTRNSFEPVIEIIKERQHPLSALFDLAGRLESLTPLLEKGCRGRLAVHCRSIFHLRFISSNPLRIENFSMMTFIPKHHASYERVCETFRRKRERNQQIDYVELYVETTPESNLYQRRDGSWRLRFNERDFKNEKGIGVEEGVLSAPYDIAVVPSVWPSLAEYMFRHRPVLNQLLRDKLQLVRPARGLASLSPEEELSILHCPYVFRPLSTGMECVSLDKLSEGYGASQIPPERLSNQILALTSKYLPECKGFCAHACRHLVATEYIKNHPDGYEEAAVALHNTAAIVRKHYAWVEVGDLIKPWSNYHEELKEKYDKGEI